eukprot:TRINITY_DN24950_c0_g1_i1.p1 TRINITY_DN24950_c0_g1~~TRINITY_DN24950_c0_g1_i1.p1  ORF type:complete len:139 (-),score=20.01 TRINITY_DN24950_c0_g1_i1:32-427(-)
MFVGRFGVRGGGCGCGYREGTSLGVYWRRHAALYHSQVANFGKFHGVVKLWNSAKGWGFVTQDDSKTDLFVHVNDIQSTNNTTFKSLTPGQRVTFDCEKRVRGMVARNLKVLDMATSPPAPSPTKKHANDY